MNTISFEEIQDWKKFQDLCVGYFNKLNSRTEGKSTGIGPDGGKDIIVKIKGNDQIIEFQRKWIVQCKFLNENVSTKHLRDDNLPTLIHSEGAVGYLLICKNDVSSKLVNLFEDLNRNCKFGYRYEYWTGSSFIEKIRDSGEDLIKQFFPKYYDYTKKIELSQG